jgi:multiple sugar transport system permease protein
MPDRRSRKPPRLWLVAFLLPVCIGLGLVYYSAVQGLTMGFTDWDIISSPSWVGFKNFVGIWNDVRFWQAIENTMIIAVITVPAKLAVGLLAAVLLHKQLGPTNAILRFIYFYPTTCSVVAIGLMWLFVYDADGLLNRTLIYFGLDSVRWLNFKNALLSVSIMITWIGFGYVALIYLAGLANIPEEYYDAARVDGASEWRQFWHITLPMLTPTTFFLMIISLIAALQTFGEVYVIDGPSDSTLTIVQYIYEKAFTQFDMGYAAALSWVLIAVILVATVIQVRLQRYWVSYEL